jgi:hypothetical protein
VREAPLGYVIHDGAIFVCAGFGRRTAWLANVGADPTVEVVLPGARVAGIAEEVVDREAYATVLPELIRALGVVGRAAVPDVLAPGDGRTDPWFETMPLVRIRVTGMLDGPWDPGGRGWIAMAVLDAAVLALVLAAVAGRRCRRDQSTSS